MRDFEHGRFFEHFRIGDVITHATPRTITMGDASLYIALTGSRHIVPSAKTTAEALGFRDQPIDDLLAFHIAFGKTVPDISVNAMANLGYAEVIFHAPVYPGDTLTTTSTVIGLRENSNGKSGIVYVRSESQNQQQQTVLSWVRWVMVKKRDLSAPSPQIVVPELAPVVPVDRFTMTAVLDARQFSDTLSGSSKRWGDYKVGQRINHPSGITIEDSEHMLATRLYQNNARLHFDHLMMTGTPFQRRLMYGGHVISICRALSYDGLANALCIAAINAGTHCNPCFGGDTIYCWHEVLDKWTIPNNPTLGALRLRMVGVKNTPADQVPNLKQDNQYLEAVVLDLDYSVLLPN